MKELYESQRAGPSWNSTLLMITYDDRVPRVCVSLSSRPAQDISAQVRARRVLRPRGPSARALARHDMRDEVTGFDFTRLGVRVPAVFASPYIAAAAGTVVRRPRGPNATQFDHLSIPALRRWFAPAAGNLTAMMDGHRRGGAARRRCVFSCAAVKLCSGVLRWPRLQPRVVRA